MHLCANLQKSILFSRFLHIISLDSSLKPFPCPKMTPAEFIALCQAIGTSSPAFQLTLFLKKIGWLAGKTNASTYRAISLGTNPGEYTIHRSKEATPAGAWFVDIDAMNELRQRLGRPLTMDDLCANEAVLGVFVFIVATNIAVAGALDEMTRRVGYTRDALKAVTEPETAFWGHLAWRIANPIAVSTDPLCVLLAKRTGCMDTTLLPTELDHPYATAFFAVFDDTEITDDEVVKARAGLKYDIEAFTGFIEILEAQEASI
jgi:hypothetical protein